jgi:hypothetical protein
MPTCLGGAQMTGKGNGECLLTVLGKNLGGSRTLMAKVKLTEWRFKQAKTLGQSLPDMKFQRG